jgi:hypothetical protein
MWLHIVKPLAFRINHIKTLNVNKKSEAQQKKLKTVRGSYIDLDLSIHAKKGPEKSRDTLPLRYLLETFLSNENLPLRQFLSRVVPGYLSQITVVIVNFVD